MKETKSPEELKNTKSTIRSVAISRCPWIYLKTAP